MKTTLTSIAVCAFITLSPSAPVFAQSAPATEGPKYSPEQISRLKTFQTDLSANNLDGSYTDMIDCGGYFLNLADALPGIGGDENLTKIARMQGQQFQISSMIVGMMSGVEGRSPDSAKSSIAAKQSTYAALYQGPAIYTEASVTKMKYCASYKAVNDTLTAAAKKMMDKKG